MDNLDIVFIITDLDIGGTERHLVTLAKALVGRGASVDVYCLRGEGSLAQQLREGGVGVIADASTHSNSLGRFWRLRQWLKRRRPEIVHYFLPEAYLIGSLATPTSSRRIMSRRSLNDYQKKHPIATRLERYCHRRLDRALANADAVAAQLYSEGIEKEKIDVIYTGVEAKQFAADSRLEARAAFNIERDATVILMVANLIPYKGHTDALQALYKFSTRFAGPWIAMFVGEDRGCGGALSRQTGALELESHVRWCGQVADIQPFLAAADIGFLTSHEEGLSTFVLEAMAAGLPVVATRVGGNEEAIMDNHTGLLAPAADSDALAEALNLLATDSALRVRMSDAARLRIEERFPIEDCIDAYCSVYTDATS